MAAALFVGLLTAEGPVDVPEAEEPMYHATATLLSTGPPVPELATLSTLVTSDKVTERVAASTDAVDEPSELRDRLEATATEQPGILTITTTSSEAEEAETIANAFARQVVKLVDERFIDETDLVNKGVRGSIAGQLRSLDKRIDQLRQRIIKLEKRAASQVAAAHSEIELQRLQLLLQIQRDALTQRIVMLQTRREQKQQLVQPTASPGPAVAGDLEIVKLATAQLARPETAEEESSEQDGSPGLGLQVVIATFLGSLAGLTLALVVERFDTRIRSREEAARYFGLPVLAEIPAARGGTRSEVTASRFGLSTSTGLQVLAATLVSSTTGGADDRDDQVLERAEQAQVILITSASSQEPTASVGATLGATLGGWSRDVLLICADLQERSVAKMLDIPETRGLVDIVQPRSETPGEDGVTLDPFIQTTSLTRVRILPAGHLVDARADLDWDRLRKVIQEARKAADVVLVVTGGLMESGAGAMLLPQADAIIVVATIGSSTVRAAQDTRDLLEQLPSARPGIALLQPSAARHRLARPSVV